MRAARLAIGTAALLAAALSMFAVSRAVSDEPEPAAPESLFIVHFTTGPAWAADKPFPEQLHAGEHSKNLGRLRKAGMILVGARYSDVGMLILRAASEEAARAEIEKDAMVQAKVFTYDISELHPFYEGCVEKNRPGANGD